MRLQVGETSLLPTAPLLTALQSSYDRAHDGSGIGMRKVIDTTGGPVIIIPENDARRWGGVFRKEFVKELGLPTDYEEMCRLVLEGEPKSSYLYENGADHALMLCLPYGTVLISAESGCVRLAQVAFAPHEWTFDQLPSSLFDGASYDEHHSFVAQAGRYMLFDSSAELEDVEDEVITFPLGSGSHIFESAMFDSDDGEMSFIFARIRKV